MDYSTLVSAKTVDGSIRNWVNYGPTPAEVIVAMAEDTIYAALRVQQMRALATGTIAEGATTLALPTGFREAITFQRTGDSGGPIFFLDIEHFEHRLGLDPDSAPFEGTPSQAAIAGGTTLHFDTTADQAYPYRLWYYATPARLSTDNETNFLTDRYSHMLLAACLYWAFSFAKDASSRDHWFAVMNNAINEANGESDLSHQSETKAIHWSSR